jgi:hypothetical protein
MPELLSLLKEMVYKEQFGYSGRKLDCTSLNLPLMDK